MTQPVNDAVAFLAHAFFMKADESTIYQGKQGNRPHHIAAWAEARGLTQADLSRELGADKSLVSRWYKGSTPGLPWQEKLAALFQTDRESLFRHPDEDWMSKFFKDRAREEVERMKSILETAFPRKRA